MIPFWINVKPVMNAGNNFILSTFLFMSLGLQLDITVQCFCQYYAWRGPLFSSLTTGSTAPGG